MADNTIKIGGELESMATGKIVAAASAIKDKSRNKTQEVINGDVEQALSEQLEQFERLSEETAESVSSAENAARQSKQYLEDLKEAITGLPDGQAVSAQVAINEVDIAGLKSNVVVDLSTRYATSYANLSAALTALNGDNATDATAIKKAGVSIKFINSTTNKYEQWVLKAASWSANNSDWVSVTNPNAEDVSYGSSNVKEELDRKKTDNLKFEALIYDILNILRVSASSGSFVLTDKNGNIVLKYDENGFDVAKVTDHAKWLLSTPSDLENYINTQNGFGKFVLTDKDGNIVLRYDDNGLDAAKVTDHIKELLQTSSILENYINVESGASKFVLTDKDGNIVLRYDENGFDIAKATEHAKEVLGGNESSNKPTITSETNQISISNLANDYRVAFRFRINKNVNISSSSDNIVTIGSDNVQLLSAATSVLNVNRSTKNRSANATYQQQPKFNSGFNIAGLSCERNQQDYKPLVGEVAFWIWLKGDFGTLQSAKTEQELIARSTELSSMSDYVLKIESDNFVIADGNNPITTISLKDGANYKQLDKFFNEVKERLGNTFAIKCCQASARLTTEALLQLGTIHLVGYYYQHLSMQSSSFGYYYDSYPVPVYLWQDKSEHTMEIVRKESYVYVGVDGIFNRISNSSKTISINTSNIDVDNLIAINSNKDVEVYKDSDNYYHVISDYSPGVLGVQIHFTEAQYTESEKSIYSGESTRSYSTGDPICVYINGLSAVRNVISIASGVSIGDTLTYNMLDNKLYNDTTEQVLGTCSQTRLENTETLSVVNGIYFQPSITRTYDALKQLNEHGYATYGCRDLLNILNGSLIPKHRSAFILKTDSNNGGGVYASMKNADNRCIFDRLNINYIIGSIIKREMENNTYYPQTEDYRNLVMSASINGKNVITHSLTHDVQLESKNSLLVQWELQENIRLAQENGLIENVYSWPGTACTSENIFTMLSLNGYVCSIGNSRGLNVLATQPFQIHRNDCADRTSWNKFYGYLI